MGFLDAAGITTLVEKLKTKFALKTELNSKQDTLVSGTNIKTINSNSLLGSGNISISYPSTLPSRQIGINETHVASDTGYRYRFWLTSADGTKWVPINTSTSTSSSTTKTLNTRPIDPFGLIVYYSNSSSVSAGSTVSTSYLWKQMNSITVGYSYVLSMTTNNPVYLKCTPQADGSAVMSVLTQTLPSSNDGYIYIFLGIATSSTAMELCLEHPVYYHDGTGLREWTGSRNDEVTQTYTSTSTSGTYQLLFSSSVSDTSTHTEGARKTATLTFTPNPAGDDTGSRLNVTSIVDIGRINFYNTSNNASNVGTGIALNVNTTGTKDLYWRSADGILNLRHYNAARGTGGTITNQFVDGAITLDPGASSDNNYYATLRLESYSELGVSAGYSRIRPNNIYLRDGNDNYAQLTATSIPTTQTATSTDANYELLFSNTADNTTRTETTRKASSLLYNPSSQQLTIGVSSYTQRITASSNSIVGHAGFEDYISESSGNYFGQLNKGVLRLRYNSLGTAGDLAINAASSLSATCQGLMISGNNDVDYLGTGNYNVPNFANVTSGSELTATHLTIKNANGSTQFDRTGLTINDGTNDHTITATKVDNWDSAIRSAGTGLSKSGTTLNHSNSVSAQSTSAVYPITIDAQGHIASYGSAVTNIVRTTSTQTLTNKTLTSPKINTPTVSSITQVVTSTSNISNWATADTYSTSNTTGGVGTISDIWVNRWGPVVQGYIRFTSSSAAATGTTRTFFTPTDLFKSKGLFYLQVNATSSPYAQITNASFWFTSGGIMQGRCAASTEYRVSFMYLATGG